MLQDANGAVRLAVRAAHAEAELRAARADLAAHNAEAIVRHAAHLAQRGATAPEMLELVRRELLHLEPSQRMDLLCETVRQLASAQVANQRVSTATRPVPDNPQG